MIRFVEFDPAHCKGAVAHPSHKPQPSGQEPAEVTAEEMARYAGMLARGMTEDAAIEVLALRRRVMGACHGH